MHKNTVLSRYTVKMNKDDYRKLKVCSVLNDKSVNDYIVDTLIKEISKSK